MPRLLPILLVALLGTAAGARGVDAPTSDGAVKTATPSPTEGTKRAGLNETAPAAAPDTPTAAVPTPVPSAPVGTTAPVASPAPPAASPAEPPASGASSSPSAASRSSPPAAIPAAEAAPDLQSILSNGRAWLEETFPDTDFSQLDALDQTQLLETLRPLAQAFEEGGFENLAASREHAAQVLAWLRAQPWGEPYADWLAPRMDYFDVAAETETAAREQWAAEQTRPAPTAPSITLPRDPASAPSTLRFQVVRERVQRSAATKSAWARRIAARPPPARAAELAPPLKEIFRAEGLPPEMVWLAEVESSFDPQAQSPVGARGLFQFMPATAQRFGLKTFPVDERTDPAKSGRAAAQYLRVLHARFGDWPLALAAYNAGEGRVGRTLEGSKARSFDGIAAQLPAETRLYVPKVMATVAAREGVDPFALPAPKELPPAVKPPASPAAVGAAAPAKSTAPALPVVAAEAGPLRTR